MPNKNQHTRPISSIRSEQTQVHSDLPALVARHAAHVFQKPFALHNKMAFYDLMIKWHQRGLPPLILDSCCGVGESTLHIAKAHPDCFVVGVDQSLVRINTQKTWWQESIPDNLLWLRADAVDVWRQLAGELRLLQRPLYKHYILYPNPYPKIGQLHKRWHGHAVFPTILNLGGTLEVRSNWQIYIDEFAQAVTQLRDQPPSLHGEYALTMAQAITPFERKYHERGEALWRCRFEL